jgi:hypothetical protein
MLFKKSIKIWQATLIILITVICTSFFYILVANPISLYNYFSGTESKAADLQTTVAKNPYNTLAQQLSDWEDDLDKRESGLNELEKKITEKSQIEKILIVIIAIFLPLLFVLIFLNFYFDYKRRKAKRDNN